MQRIFSVILLALSLNGYAQSCIDSAAIQYGAYCDPRFEPVCGCDGYTYQNDCFARNAGLLWWTSNMICDPVDFYFVPNPPTPPYNIITVDAFLRLPGVMYVEVLDRFGRLYFRNSYQVTDHIQFQIDFSGWPLGVYLLRCYNDEGSRTKKVVTIIEP